MSNQNQEDQDQRALATRKKLKISVAAMAAVLVVLVVILAWQSYFAPQRDAQGALDRAVASRGKITALNTSLVTYKGQKLESANVDQKGLAESKKLTTPPAFIFTNGKKNSDRKVVDFYFDFSDQKARDALISNSVSLQALVESGKIELRLHPLFGGRAYSMYAAESVSEVFAADPDHAWSSLMVLLRNAPVLSASDSNDATVKGIVSALKEEGVSAVDAESIKNGTFATWLLSIGDDPKLNSASALKLPYILLSGKQLDLSVDQLNDPDAFRRAVLEETN